MIKDGKEFLSLQKMLEFIGHTQELYEPQDSLSALIDATVKSAHCRQGDCMTLSDDELSDVAGGVYTEDPFFRKR